MTDYYTTALRSPLAAPPGAVKPARDPVLAAASGGVRFLFDLDFSWCYPGGAFAGRPAPAAPLDNQVIYDIAERGNGRYVFNTVFEAPRATYAGGGFDYTNVTHSPYGVQGPNDAWASIHAAANDYFLVCSYMRLPTEAEWKPSGGIVPFFDSNLGTGFWIGQAEMLIMGFLGGTNFRGFQFARQTAVGSQSSLYINALGSPVAFGKFCQVAYWRNAAGVRARVKSVDGELSASGAVGANNTADYSALRPTWGSYRSPNLSFSAEDVLATNYRVYRGWLEDLTMSGRDPLSVLNADWDRVIARKTASGGTIFA